MEESFHFIPNLSLYQLTLRQLAVHMWNKSLILAELENFKFESFSDSPSLDKWNAILFKIKKNVSTLVLPMPVIENVMHLVISVGREILRWKFLHEYIFGYKHKCLDVDALEKLCWTCIGTVDYRKTAEELVTLETLDVKTRYRLACLYCLEDNIPVIWKELPRAYRRRYRSRGSVEKVDWLEYYWASVLKGEEPNPSRFIPFPYVRGFSSRLALLKYSAYQGSKAAVEYILQRYFLPSVEDRDKALYEALCETIDSRWCLSHLRDGRYLRIYKPDVFWYLLSSMTHEMQMLVLKERPDTCLIFFLGWPWQDFFLDILDHIWEFISEDRYDSLLDKLYWNISIEGQYFPGLIQKVFMGSPNDFKKRFVDKECQCECPLFFPLFTKFKDAETIKLVLGYLDSGDRMRLLSNRGFFCFFKDLLYSNKRPLVDMCLGETVLTKEERKIVKEAYMQFCTEYEKSRHIFDWLDETSESTNNITYSENETLTNAKRLLVDVEKDDSTKKLKRH